MTIKRMILIVLTIVSLLPVFLSLGESLGQPQVQARLQLYQTNLVLQATEFQSQANLEEADDDFAQLRQALLGVDPYATAEEQYKEARQLALKSRDGYQAQLQQLIADIQVAADTTTSQQQTITVTRNEAPQRQRVQQSIDEVQAFINEIDLELGILQAQRGATGVALSTWENLRDRAPFEVSQAAMVPTAKLLIQLWQDKPVMPNAEGLIEQTLTGWFRYRTLAQLYQQQGRQAALQQLQAQEQAIASQALFKFILVVSIPFLGGILGVGLLIFLIAQRLIGGERSLLATNSGVAWETPWNWEVVWQVLIVGFFFLSQILLNLVLIPILFSLLGIDPTTLSLRGKAFFVLVSYLLVAAGGLLVIYLSIKQYLPLPPDWFRFRWLGNWILWGIGGYLVALPLVVVVSLVNQQIWQGQGGSNPLLFLALQAHDKTALIVFFLTASLAAPLFEEIFFRGFLLPSLTRYLPVWGAVGVSSLVFSLAHLSLSEVLPLATLGIVLGVVYTRSRNLLAPILLHSLWNSGTLLSLVVLGSGGQ